MPPYLTIKHPVQTHTATIYNDKLCAYYPSTSALRGVYKMWNSAVPEQRDAIPIADAIAAEYTNKGNKAIAATPDPDWAPQGASFHLARRGVLIEAQHAF